MTKNALWYAAIVTAYILGMATGILAVKECMERKYRKLADEEVESVKDAFEARLKKRMERTKEESAKIDAIYTHLLENARRKSEDTEEESGPVVIPPEEFEEDEEYETRTLTYYASEGTFLDEVDEPLDDNEWRNALGADILHHFGEYEEDRVCVRNDRRRIYYEVLRDDEDYSP